jgi:hypothetical protein
MCDPKRSLVGLCVAVLLALTCAASIGGATTPSLYGPLLSPSSGDTSTLFTFLITCRSDSAPTTRLLYLDDKSYTLTSCGAAPMGGTMYRYQTKLTAGTHKYRFSFVVGTQTLLSPGPADTNWYTSFSVKQAATFSVSGVVRCNGAGLSSVTLRFTRPNTAAVHTKTDSQGKYTMTGLAAGTWTVTPSLYGFTFTPDHANVTLPPSSTTCNFTATRAGRSG